jgi:hypothetical protein
MTVSPSLDRRPHVGARKDALVRLTWGFAVAMVLAAAMLNTAAAEVEGCNAERVKGLLLRETFQKFKAGLAQELDKGLNEKPNLTPAYVCPPFVPPANIGARPPSGYVQGQGYRAPNMAPYNPNVSGTGQVKADPPPMTADQYRESHLRSCAIQQSNIDKENQLIEQRYRERHAFFQRKAAAIEKLNASLENVRQRQYDAANDTRFCMADVVYQNLQSDLVWIGSPACARLVSYKIERLLDKPNDFYVSWSCDR